MTPHDLTRDGLLRVQARGACPRDGLLRVQARGACPRDVYWPSFFRMPAIRFFWSGSFAMLSAFR